MTDKLGDRLSTTGSRPKSSLSVISNFPTSTSTIIKKVPVKERCEGYLKIMNTIETPKDVMCVSFLEDGALVAVGQTDGVIKIYATDSLQNIYTLSDNDIKTGPLPVTCMRSKPSDHTPKKEDKHVLIATYASGLIKYWHYTSGKCLSTIDETKLPNAKKSRQSLGLSISPKGYCFVSCGSTPEINLYDIESRKIIRTFEASEFKEKMDGQVDRVFVAKFHPNNGNVFLTGGWDDTVHYWDMREQRSTRHIFGPHICGDALDIDATYDHILTGSWRKSNPLEIWDFDKAQLIKEVPQDHLRESMLYSCQWLGKDSIVCGGSEENVTRTIDRGTLTTIGQLVDIPGGVYSIDNNRQGLKPKLAIGAGTSVYIMRTDTKS